MRIIDKETDESIKEVYLFFTQKEGLELSHEFKKLLESPDEYILNVKGEDLNGEMTKEINIRIYNEKNINTFDQRIKKLILENK